MLAKSRVVKIGNEFIGGDHRISVQSMTNTNTLDTKATVDQIERIYKEGCDIIRLTVRDKREAENLKLIKKELIKLGINIPLVADVHFNPKVAEIAAKYVEKVRINPGNYVDKRRSKEAFSEDEYILEQNKIAQRLKPLLEICTQHNTAIRIGTNLGSLSERILYKYGNTPMGMVESALEFIEVCRKFEFHNLVLSMKASHVPSMIEANRLLVEEMNKRGYYYPLHLGVTEAGDGDEGRIKAAAGIGSLLADGIGDTIRVSLTEDPENEVVYGNKLLSEYAKRTKLSFDSILTKEPNTNDFLLSYNNLNEDDLLIKATTDFTRQYKQYQLKEVKIINDNIENNLLSDKILQALGIKYTKAEFIACPSCGRTLFNIIEELEKVRKETSHLKGLKIAVMGCIVNGIGEMADADYGYVGAGPDKVNIYKKKQLISKNIPAVTAVNNLVQLIKDNNDWK